MSEEQPEYLEIEILDTTKFTNGTVMEWLKKELPTLPGYGTKWKIRSRPHTPAPETISKELALELCMDARKEAALTATLDTLHDLMKRHYLSPEGMKCYMDEVKLTQSTGQEHP